MEGSASNELCQLLAILRRVFSRVSCDPKNGVDESLGGFARRHTGLRDDCANCVKEGEVERRNDGAHTTRTTG
jgi:hypothetical protein